MSYEEFDIAGAFKQQNAQLAKLHETAKKDLYWRKIATGAAIAGALFAAVRLTDIWLAVRRGRQS